MKFRQFQNEKGITLVELLAALGLFALVIALSSTIIIQMVNSEGKTSEKVSIQQEMNVVISELRNSYYNEEPMCLNDKENRFTIDVESNGEVNNNCIKIYNEKEPLLIEVTAVDNVEKNFTVKTTLKNKKDYVFNEETDDEETDDEETDDEETDNIPCEFEGDYTNLTLKNGRCEDNKYDMKGSLKVIKQTTLEAGVELKIDGSAQFVEDIKLQKGAKIFTSHSTHIVGDVFCNGEKMPVQNNSILQCEQKSNE